MYIGTGGATSGTGGAIYVTVGSGDTSVGGEIVLSAGTTTSGLTGMACIFCICFSMVYLCFFPWCLGGKVTIESGATTVGSSSGYSGSMLLQTAAATSRYERISAVRFLPL